MMRRILTLGGTSTHKSLKRNFPNFFNRGESGGLYSHEGILRRDLPLLSNSCRMDESG